MGENMINKKYKCERREAKCSKCSKKKKHTKKTDPWVVSQSIH
jgi:hypothetical protein